MTKYPTTPLPSSKSYTQNSECCNSWALNWQLLTHIAWVDVFRQRFTLRQQQLQGGPPSTCPNRQFVPTPSLLTNQVAATHFRDVPSSLTSTASQISVAAWLVCPFAVFSLFTAHLAQFAYAHRGRDVVQFSRGKNVEHVLQLQRGTLDGIARVAVGGQIFLFCKASTAAMAWEDADPNTGYVLVAKTG